MAVQPGDLVEQLGAKAVHDAHDDDECGDAQHHRDQADPGDERDERLSATGQQITARDHSLVAR